MKTNIKIKILCMCLLSPVAFVAAQRGTGEEEGVSRQQTPVVRHTVTGQVIDVKIARCELSTGTSDTGMHYFLKTEEDLILNLHLGPDHAVKALGLPVDPGFPLTATVFRTENHREHHWVVISATLGDSTIRLREENLRPVWAARQDRPARRRGR